MKTGIEVDVQTVVGGSLAGQQRGEGLLYVAD